MCKIAQLAENTTADLFGFDNIEPVVTWVITMGSFGIIINFSAMLHLAQRAEQSGRFRIRNL